VPVGSRHLLQLPRVLVGFPHTPIQQLCGEFAKLALCDVCPAALGLDPLEHIDEQRAASRRIDSLPGLLERLGALVGKLLRDGFAAPLRRYFAGDRANLLLQEDVELTRTRKFVSAI
jgi:hypothetical protein